MMASSAPNPRQSSPMPGPFSTVPWRVTLTLVPSGNTVSRCAANHHIGPRSRARPHADHVSGFIDANIFQPQRAKQTRQFLAADLLHKRRRWNFADSDLLINEMRFVTLRRFHGALDRRVGEQGRRILSK